MNTSTRIIIGILVVLVLVLIGYIVWGSSAQVPQENEETATTTPNTNTGTTQITIALLDTTGEGSGKSRGCDNVNMVTRTIPQTGAPLTAAMQTLFAENEGAAGSTTYNFIARTKNTLKFDRATIEDGTANIYLTGSLSGLAGVCDDPRAQIQIEETALQFSTVERVQIYLNEVATTLTPSQQ